MQENKIDFDLSKLSLKELIEVYKDMSDFIQFLNESKIEMEADKDE